MAPSSPQDNQPIVIAQEEVKKKPAARKKKKAIVEPVEEKLQEQKVEDVKVVAPVTDPDPAKEREKELQEMAEFLASKENKQKALHLATQIRDLVGKGWFSLKTLLRKTKGGENEMSAYQKIQLCKMFGLVAGKVGDYTDGKENLRTQLFKITIGPKHELDAVNDIIRYHQNQIDDLMRAKRSLEEKIARQEAAEAVLSEPKPEA